MKCSEDLVIEKKYLNLINRCIYDVEKDKHGIITGLSTLSLIGGIFMEFTARYDNIDSDKHVFLNDFKTGEMKFVLLTGGEWGKGFFKKSQEEQLENIKDVFGNEYRDDMVMWIDECERKTALSKQDHRQKQYIGSQLVNLDSFAEDVVYDSYSTLQAFCLYTDGIIDEKQMLYAMVNILAAEKRVQRDMKIDSTHKTFSEEIRKCFEENKDFWMELIKSENEEKSDGT